jgi:hypothetical protein
MAEEEAAAAAVVTTIEKGKEQIEDTLEEELRCLRNQTEAKVVRTFSKNVGLPKIEADLCRYQRQHNAGSLFNANFKVKTLNFLLFFELRCFLTKVVLPEYTAK